MKDENVGVFGTLCAIAVCFFSVIGSSVPGAIVGAAMLICMEIAALKGKP